MDRSARIEQIIKQNIVCDYFLIENESHRHLHGSEDSHFKLRVVSGAWRGMPLIKRHRQVQTWLAEEFSHGLHALHMELLTPEEFEKSAERSSPPCKNT